MPDPRQAQGAYAAIDGDGSTTSNVLWTIHLLVAGMADNVLKPRLLGRGVDAPMVVILIGALGAMVTGGSSGSSSAASCGR